LISSGHQVSATTRSATKAEELQQLGATVVIVDGLDEAAIAAAVAAAKPEAIIHQMTALAGKPDLKHFDRWFAATNLLRTKGIDHLLAAAKAAGVKRVVAQSYTGWNNMRAGGSVKTEDDPLDANPVKAQTETWRQSTISNVQCSRRR
jgi:nucleoside-diphosphate-sugar epimerase